MIHALIVAMIALTATACGSSRCTDGPYRPFLNRFDAIARQYGKVTDSCALDVKEVSTLGKPTAVAACDPVFFEVQVRASAWRYLSQADRESILFHELGHCLLHRDHYDRRLADGRPVSLMNSEGLDGEVYLSHKEEYLNELFR